MHLKIHSGTLTLPRCQTNSTYPCAAPRLRDNGIMEEVWGSGPLGLLLEESSKLIKVTGTIKQGAGTAVNDRLRARS